MAGPRAAPTAQIIAIAALVLAVFVAVGPEPLNRLVAGIAGSLGLMAWGWSHPSIVIAAGAVAIATLVAVVAYVTGVLGPRASLEDVMDDLAAHLRAYDRPHLAAAIDDARNGDPEGLPTRVVGLFQHGMGGLLDLDLYRDGQPDERATAKRNELAERMYQLVKRRGAAN
jgi:hypothetical protein